MNMNGYVNFLLTFKLRERESLIIPPVIIRLDLADPSIFSLKKFISGIFHEITSGGQGEVNIDYDEYFMKIMITMK